MGLNFNDYDGLQSKTTPPKHISRQCSLQRVETNKKCDFLYIVVSTLKKIINIKGTNMSTLTLNYAFYAQNKLSLRFLEHSIISTLWSASSSQLMCYAVPGSAYKSYRQLLRNLCRQARVRWVVGCKISWILLRKLMYC